MSGSGHFVQSLDVRRVGMVHRLKSAAAVSLILVGGCMRPEGNTARAEAAPLITSAASAGEGCVVQIGGERIEASRTDDEVRSLVSRWPNRRAIVRVGAATRYRCVGRLIYVLQGAGFSISTEAMSD
jgi:hypothetical protein